MYKLPKDPWTWVDLSPDELEYLSKQCGDGPYLPMFQLVAVNTCNDLRPLIEADQANSGGAVLEAVFMCARNGLVMPDWLATAFMVRYCAVTHFHAASWDSPLSFGRHHPKGTRLAAELKRFKFQSQVALRITLIRHDEPGTPIDKNLFERVGKPFGLGATLTEDYYYTYVRENYISSIFKSKKKLSPAKSKKLAGRLKRRL